MLFFFCISIKIFGGKKAKLSKNKMQQRKALNERNVFGRVIIDILKTNGQRFKEKVI